MTLDLRRMRRLIAKYFFPTQLRGSDMSLSTAETLVKAAHARRAELLAIIKWYDTPTVSVRQGGGASESESGAIVRKLRQSSCLFGVWSGQQYLHPAFQFDPQTGRLFTQVRDLLELMPSKLTEWQQCFWLFAPNAQLDGACPADIFPTNAAAVLEVARTTFKVSLAA
jgi:hypothetical protein